MMQMNSNGSDLKLFPSIYDTSSDAVSSNAKLTNKWSMAQYSYGSNEVIPSPPLHEQRVENFQDHHWQDINNFSSNSANSFSLHDCNSDVSFQNNYVDWSSSPSSSAPKPPPPPSLSYESIDKNEGRYVTMKQNFPNTNNNNSYSSLAIHKHQHVHQQDHGWTATKTSFPETRSRNLTGNILHDLNDCWDVEGEMRNGGLSVYDPGACEGGGGANEMSAGLLDDMDLSDLDNACMEQMEKQYYKEALLEVQSACAVLSISPDPQQWSPEESQKWISWTIYHCNLPQVDVSAFRKSGSQICSLTEKQMRALAPHCGDILHARLDVWQAAFKRMMHPREPLIEIGASQSIFPEQDIGANVMGSKQNQPFQEEKFLKSKPSSKTKSKSRRNEEKTIHLWKFLIQLLQQPRNHQRAVRWLNQEQGVFKIEDSEELARLWGIRKNRPAMNYDKLSRSIRQYYKKGIIRKTEITRRLVYQFVLPII